MSQPQLLQIKLSRFDAQPWGFRLQGGVDFASPLLVQKVNGGSLAEQAGLMPGDSVVKINDVDVFNLRHKEAQDVVVRSGNNFVMTVQRGGSTWRPQITPTGQLPQPNSPYLQTVTKTSLAHKQLESQHVGCGYNNAAKPFTQGVDGSVKSIVNKQYNSPVGIYSDESIAETLSAQAEVLAGGVLGVNFKKNEKEYHAEKSEVLKLLREEESGKSTPVTCVETAASSTSNFYWTHSHAIGGNERRYTSVSQKQHDERTGTKLQHQTLAPAATHRPNLSATMATQTGNKFKPIDEHQSGGSEAAITTDNDFATASASQPDPRLIVMPVCPALQTPEYKAELEAAAAAAAQDGSPRPLSAGGHPACQMCGVGIVGVFVRIKDKNLHVECFKCATCGTSLKNQGYYNFNNKLYCDIHAKLAALQNPPAGTEGYVPVPIKPNTKLSASTISSALSAHGYNGVANGNSGTPTPSSVVAPNASTSIIVSSSQVDKVRDSVNSNCNSNCTTVTNATNEMFPTMATMPSNITSADNGDKPFEYVTLTGNVIRSVVPPGKGSNVNYKVSQGYVRPFGAIPATTTPRSSVIYPPQPQQWSASAPPPTQSKPISNPYATLPRSNVGQQEPALKMGNISGTLPSRKSSNALSSSKVKYALPTKTETLEHILAPDDEATVMLSESIGKMNLGTKTNNFMIEAGKVISDMLEARLANGGPPLQSKNNLNSLNNQTSTSPRSPLVARKRLDLDNFKEINPTEPAALKPVGTLQQTLERNPNQNQQSSTEVINAGKLLTNHPTNQALDMCDNKSKSLSFITGHSKHESKNAETLQPLASIALTNADPLPHSETVIYRNNGGSNRRASHATDRRSYIENNTQQNRTNNNDCTQHNSGFGIYVKALGSTNSDRPMSAENEEVVSQLVKDGKRPMCCQCHKEITAGPFITALGRIWCPEHFICVNANCRRALQDIGFVEEKGDLYCEYCFEKYLAPTCSKCGNKIKGDCLNAIGKHFHPECFNCAHCGKLFGNTPFFLEDGNPYCEADWNELFTTKCFACGFPVEAGDRWVEALNHNYHSQCFNCTYCKQNLEGQSFYNKGGRPFCKNHAR
ncbi:PDZ and LIM domain protein Zasp isoform X10 [Glossina fuscipes]|uniref:PDZ and LIM domain protein Zasp isoform X10 n=1 Tax=Glossina fuscipes TaxID=7396 RepID=A0A9C6DP11_9MUSC|nr:PDZ and LIM domain protein Zasp isoform X10 [Glossina fuscipes]